MKKIIFPGIFDPPTMGHLDIIKRAATLFDYVYVAVGNSILKENTAFTMEERVDLLKSITTGMKNVEVISFEDLIVDCAKRLNVQSVLRSMRNMSDFDHEDIQAQMNWHLGKIETLYMVANEEFRLISSTLIKEIARHGRRLQPFIPEAIEEKVFNRLSNLSISAL